MMRTALVHLRPAALAVVCAMIVLAGCQTPGAGLPGRVASRRTSGKQPVIRYVRCFFDHRPWINADYAGDRDPEGIRYRVFLDPGTGEGVLAEGTFHIEMYRIQKTSAKKVERTLISDWHYPTSIFSTIAKPGYLGDGYYLRLRWAKKDTAGQDIELITRFEDPDGNVVQSATKAFRVPKRAS